MPNDQFKERRMSYNNYDLSVIFVVSDCDSSSLSCLLKCLPYFEKNGVEVIVSITDTSPIGELSNIIKVHWRINWKVVRSSVNSKYYGVLVYSALAQSVKTKSLIVPQSTFFLNDIINLIDEKIMEYPSYYFYITRINSVLDSYNLQEDRLSLLFPNGPILACTQQLKLIASENIYCENERMFLIALQLELSSSGYQRFMLPQCKIESNVEEASFIRANVFCGDQKEYVLTLESIRYEIVYNWMFKLVSQEVLLNYIEKFEKTYVNLHFPMTTCYKRILLAQSYNEAENIVPFLQNMGKYFDCMILLDDGSTDGTFDLAEHMNLLIKVRKHRTNFDDLLNRNILLDLASFLNSEWICFMDIDERFDDRFNNFEEFESNPDADAIVFNAVEIWNDDFHYNALFPASTLGFHKRLKMFRNIGRTQIYSKTKLHFPCVPFYDKKYVSKILYHHLGHKTPQMRIKKYSFYISEDKERDISFYNYLIQDDKAVLRPLDTITEKNGRFNN